MALRRSQAHALSILIVPDCLMRDMQQGASKETMLANLEAYLQESCDHTPDSDFVNAMYNLYLNALGK